MNAEDFLERVEKEGGELADYLDEVAEDANSAQSERGGFTLLFGVASYALYRMAKNYFDYQRGLNEVDLRQRMLDQVDALVQSGWSREKALAAVEKVSKDIATLRPDSAALKAALAILNAARASKNG